MGKNYGIQNSTDRLHISIIGETSSGTAYSWSITNSSNIVLYYGSGEKEVPSTELVPERYIASQLSETEDLPIYIIVIIEDEEDD